MKKNILFFLTFITFMLYGNEEMNFTKINLNKQTLVNCSINRKSTVTLEEILNNFNGTNQYIFYNNLIYEMEYNDPYLFGLDKDKFETNAEYQKKVENFKKRKKALIKEKIESYVLEERIIEMSYNPELQRWEIPLETYLFDLSYLDPSSSSYKKARFKSGSIEIDRWINRSCIKFKTNGKKIFFNEERNKARERGSLNVKLKLVCSSKGIKKVLTKEDVQCESLFGTRYIEHRYIIHTNVLGYVLTNEKTGTFLKQEIFEKNNQVKSK